MCCVSAPVSVQKFAEVSQTCCSPFPLITQFDILMLMDEVWMHRDWTVIWWVFQFLPALWGLPRSDMWLVFFFSFKCPSLTLLILYYRCRYYRLRIIFTGGVNVRDCDSKSCRILIRISCWASQTAWILPIGMLVNADESKVAYVGRIFIQICQNFHVWRTNHIFL